MATKKKFGIQALSSTLEDKDSREQTPSEARSPSQKRVSSPINSPAMSGASKRIQRLYLDLPVSKATVECDLMELDPAHCVASVLNKRVQSLLHPDDVAVQQLVATMREEGQRDPVLVRPLAKPDGEVRYEVIYGTRRRFAAQLIGSTGQPGFTLKAWVSDRISDADAKRLADSENDDRESISAWERAVYLARVKADRSTDVVAAMEGVDRSLVTRYIQLAELPEALVALVGSPSQITLRAGLDICMAIKALSTVRFNTLVSAITRGERYAGGAELLSAIRQQLAPPPAAARSSDKVELRDEAGKKRVVIGAHRRNKDQYKLDLYGMSEKDMVTVQRALEKLLDR